jgi:imidazolonepropionase-like amidohydrolase
MVINKYIILFLVFLSTDFIKAQIGFQSNDVNSPEYTKYALIHANIFIDADTYVSDATLLVENGKIMAVGKSINIPKDATIIDVKNKYIMASFIETFSSLGIEKTENKHAEGNQMNSNKTGPYSWNEAIEPEVNAVDYYKLNQEQLLQYIQAGFGVVLTHQNDGIMRGSGALVYTQPLTQAKKIYQTQAATFYSFNKGSSTQDYPSSLMGSIALLRQSLYDAQWYKTALEKTPDLSLEAYNNLEKLPKIFEVNNNYDMMRAYKISEEFKSKFIYKTDGQEYQIIHEIIPIHANLIVPVNFSKPLNPLTFQDWKYVSYKDMLHYEQGPTNLYQLYKNNINFCITADGCKLQQEFYKNIYKAIEQGLPSRAVLKALTQTPASFISIEKKIGVLKPGFDAFFIVTSDSIGSKNFEVLENWSLNKRKVIFQSSFTDLRGKYIYKYDLKTDTIYIDDSMTNPSVKWGKEKGQAKINIDYTELTFSKISITFKSRYSNESEWTSNIYYKDSLGKIIQESVGVFTKIGLIPTKFKTVNTPLVHLYPYAEFGDTIIRKNTTKTLFKNATIWTAESEGVISNSDIMIDNNGKIVKIGKNITCNDCQIIDATGKHIAPGIIDEHSHIAIRHGVNEGTQSVTSEVRIGDVLFPEDINIYRQLAGGVTSSHLLHGSANCIGGQTQLIKLRWGKGIEELKMNDWDGYIKFALGENVKQSNWGDRAVVRYPQTRMGVEQVMIDAFTRAKEYKQQWMQYSLGKIKTTPRRDLELDALVEILEDKRHITCHSYVQSEINMLIHVADSMGFKVNTFTHILEGYKVADKMKKHGAAGSTFADWWAYKHEVMEAIPYNAFLLHKMGIVTAVNSDDAEMARRLNQEAAKSAKYGQLSDTECIKLCTINPAKMMRVDSHTGSIKVGKDADIVVWDNNPMDIQAKVLQTYIDGICYYDIYDQNRLKSIIEANRKRLILKMSEAIKNGENSETPTFKSQEMYNCKEDE